MKIGLRDLFQLAGVGLAAAVLGYACNDSGVKHKTNHFQVGVVEKNPLFSSRHCSLKLNTGTTIVYMHDGKGYLPDEVKFYVNERIMTVEEGEPFNCDPMHKYYVIVAPKKNPKVNSTDLGALVREEDN